MYNASLRYFSDHIEDVDFNLCTLSIYVGSQHIAYSLTENNRVVCYEKYNLGEQLEENLNEFINENRWLLQSYQSIAIGINHPAMLVSPMQVDVDDNLLTAMYGDALEMAQHNLYIQKHQLKISYGIPKKVEAVLLSNFPSATIKPFAALAIAENKHFDGASITVHCLDEYYTIIIFNGNKLIAAKTINATSNEKLSYQLLNYCKMYALNTTDAELLLSGWITYSSALKEELSKYFVKINIDDTYTKFVCEKDEHESQYFNTFEIISKC